MKRVKKSAMWLAVAALTVPTVVLAADMPEDLSSKAETVFKTLDKLTNSSSKSTVTSARKAYDNLSEDDQFAIYEVFVEKLIPLEVKFFNADVTSLVAKKDSATLSQVEALQTIYDNKEWEFQDLAIDASYQLEELVAYIENRAYIVAANQFMLDLTKLSETTITQEEYDAIVTKYENLDYSVFDYLDTTKVDEKLELLQEALYKKEAKVVQDMINAITEANATEGKIDAIIEAYDNLSFEAQEYITNYEKIEKLQNYLWGASDREEAALVQKLIDSLTEANVTYAKVVEAIEMRDALYSEAYAYLKNPEKLESLLEVAIKKEAAAVQNMLNELNELTVSEDLMYEIESAYDELELEVQEAIVNYEKIETLRAYLDEQYINAMDLESAIWGLSEESTKEEILAVNSSYSSLSALAKTLVESEAIEALQLLLNQAGIDTELGTESAEQIIQAIDEIWGSSQFVNNFNRAKAMYEQAVAAVQEKVVNQEALMNYEKLAAYWGTNTKTWNDSAIENVAATKTWTLTFSQAVLNTSVNLSKVKVFNQHGQEQAVSVAVHSSNGKNNNQLVITAPAGGYKTGESYVLAIDDVLYNEQNQPLTNGYWKYFDVK